VKLVTMLPEVLSAIGDLAQVIVLLALIPAIKVIRKKSKGTLDRVEKNVEKERARAWKEEAKRSGGDGLPGMM